MIYSEPRYTKDLDVWVETSDENARRVFAALKDFGAPLKGLTESDFTESGFYQMGRPPSRIDVLMSLDGLDFESAWESRTPEQFRGVSVFYLGKADLIHNKKLAGRYQDLADIENMERERKG